jgi:voltage-gated potassium channel
MKGSIVKNPVSKRFEIFVQILIVFSIIAFAVETLPDISPALRHALEWMEPICILVFVVE